MSNLSSFILPALFGFLYSLILIRSRVFYLNKNSINENSLSEFFIHKYINAISSYFFLFVQIFLIRYYDFGTTEGVLLLVLLFLTLALSANAYLNGISNGRLCMIACLLIFFLYWVFQKYIISISFYGWLTPILPKLDSIVSGIRLVAVVGVSYIGFKLIHFFVDLNNNNIENVNPIEFLAWLLFFPSLIAGPMMRFEDWMSQRSQNKLSLAMVLEGLQRISIGLLMKLVVADVIYVGTIAQLEEAGLIADASISDIFYSSLLYTVYLFFDFAGYSHIAIGIGLFWCIRLPENFNKPYLARNLAEFWNRWHISLSSILRDYLYYPFSLFVKRSAYFKNKLFCTTILPFLVTFIVAGIWHGAGINFLIFGALHGLGLGCVSYLKLMKNKVAFVKWWEYSNAGRIFGGLLTFFYVSFTFVFFVLPLPSLLILFKKF